MTAPLAESDDRGARLRRLLRGAMGGLVLKAAGVVLAFASQLLLARTLGVAGFGVYATVLAWCTVLALLGGFGMPLASVRFLAIYAERHDWAQYRGFLHDAWRLTVASSLAIAALVLAGFAVVPALQAMLLPMAIGAPMILLLCASGLASGAFLAAQMPLYAEGLGNVSRPVLLILLLVAIMLPGGAIDAELALALTVLAGLLVLVLQGGVLWRVAGARFRGARAHGDRPAWFRSGSAFLVTLGAFALVERLDMIMVGSMLGPAEAGSYAVASRLALLVGVALAPANAMLGPMSAQLIARGDRPGLQHLVSQGVLLSGGVALLLSLGLAVCAPWLLGLFGPGFTGGGDLLMVLAFGQCLIAQFGPAGGLLAMAGHNRLLVAMMLATVVLDLALCLVLIPRLGALGAALATAIALAANGLALSLAASRLIGVNTTSPGSVRQLLRNRALRAKGGVA
ncbi:MAG: oligosaccharide flippase family protein [Acetobacteraceae bacterium]|nr:oligosaccharide flippase family protein [Acetobacteraceae bacterium]